MNLFGKSCKSWVVDEDSKKLYDCYPSDSSWLLRRRQLHFLKRLHPRANISSERLMQENKFNKWKNLRSREVLFLPFAFSRQKKDEMGKTSVSNQTFKQFPFAPTPALARDPRKIKTWFLFLLCLKPSELFCGCCFSASVNISGFIFNFGNSLRFHCGAVEVSTCFERGWTRRRENSRVHKQR